MGGIVALTAVQVVYRYLLGSSLFWPDEAARALLIALTFLLAGASYHRGEMVAVDIAIRSLGPRWARAVRAVSLLLVLALLAALVWYGFVFAEFNAVQTTAALQVSVFWIYLTVPIGCLILAIHVALGLSELLRGRHLEKGP